jgi:(S)-mandelate dehydrogenase
VRRRWRHHFKSWRRNLDRAPNSTCVIERIAEEVGERTTMLADGSVRRGSDMAKYRSLGAKGVLIGRVPLYGVASGGAAGAGRVIEILRHEPDTVMALLGAASIEDLIGRHRYE